VHDDFDLHCESKPFLVQPSSPNAATGSTKVSV
jgi:hypothetical protein